MLANEKEQQKNIRNEIIALCEDINNINEQIVDTLSHCESCKLDGIEQIGKDELYKKTDDIDNEIVKLFALFSPEARDLRELIAFLKITNELDRISSNQRSFIRDFPGKLSKKIDKEMILENTIPLQKSSYKAFKYVVAMINEEDDDAVEEYFRKVLIEESRNDDLYKVMEKAILEGIDRKAKLANEYLEVLAATRRLEKIADRALSIAGLIRFAKLGGEMYPM